jgi:transcriptional regulator with XRE-family HTH domain
MSWAEYVREIVGTDTQKQIAKRAKVDQTTVSAWMRGTATPRTQSVLDFADGYDRKYVESILYASDLDRRGINRALRREGLKPVLPTRRGSAGKSVPRESAAQQPDRSRRGSTAHSE